jgi:hypothetical protein
MELMIWNVLLTSVVGIMGFLIKGKFNEVDRLSTLLNRTREEVARDHITRAEVRADIEKIMQRFDDGINRLETKLDKMAERNM